MLDVNKPVVGRDVEQLRQKLGISAQEMSYALGIPSMARWSSIINNNADKPLHDVNIALMVRALDAYPELFFLPTMPTPHLIFKELQKDDPDITLKRLGILLGGESSAGYRWIRMGTRSSPAVQRTCLLLQKLMKAGSGGLKKWENFVVAEATSRNIPDIWASGKWKP